LNTTEEGFKYKIEYLQAFQGHKMKTAILLTSLVLFFGISNAEIIENPTNNLHWPVSKIVKVGMVMNDDDSQYGDGAGGSGITARICHYENCCRIWFGNMARNERKEVRVSRNCQIQVNQDTRGFKVQLERNAFKVKFVDIVTENHAHFQARFGGQWIRHNSSVKRPIVFLPPDSASGVGELHLSSCPQAGRGCPNGHMIAKGIIGQWNYFCDFGCTSVTSLNPSEVGNGLRCIQTSMRMDQMDYCCASGPAGYIRGCNEDQQTSHSNENPILIYDSEHGRNHHNHGRGYGQ